jgi:hypothetical protein
MLREGINKEEDLFYFYDPSIAYEVPHLGMVRGKIVFVNCTRAVIPGQRNVDPTQVVGVWWKDWDKASRNDRVSIEDHSAEIILANKINYIKKNFQGALNNNDATRWFVTFCNADALGTGPNDPVMQMAVDDLPNAMKLRAQWKVGNYGAVFLDKPSWTLIRTLYTMSLKTLPNPQAPSITYQTIPWLSAYGADVSHVYGQDNIALLNLSSNPGNNPLKRMEVIHKGNYGIINLRFSVVQDEQLLIVQPTTSNVCSASQSPDAAAVGDGWMGTDFDGEYVSVSDLFASIVHISAGYQPGYGLTNVMVAYDDKTLPPSPLLRYQSNDTIWSPLITTAKDVRFIATWRQDRYGIVDFQSSVNL